MKILLSPAKSLELESNYPESPKTSLLFMEESNLLNDKLVKLNRQELSELMSISDQLASLNLDRYAAKHDNDHSKDRPAIFMFNGDVYDGLDINSIPSSSYDQLQDSIRILSGMYGILRPFDVLSPYRLEMGTKLKINKDTKNLYEFWKAKLTAYLTNELKEDELVINLASQEYFKAIDKKKIQNSIISPVFKDEKNGTYKVISFYAKKARGALAKYLVNSQVSDLEAIKSFNLEGYAFNASETKTETEPVFTRS